MVMITVFTPTFNRAYCLNKCYESLKRQSCFNFEWLLIDDGSTDNTKEIVNSWIHEQNHFKIRYVYKENGGMHTAYNTAYKLIDTELSINVDSDDYLVDTAIEDILLFWQNNKRDDIAGIYALDQYENGNIVGLPFPSDLREFHGWGYKVIYYTINGIKKKFVNQGDKKFIGVTDKINEYPDIPVFPNEKYHSLYYKQHLLERDYSILIMNKPVCVVEYMEDGSSNHIWNQYLNNPKGFIDERMYVMTNAPSLKLKINSSIHYVAESLIAKNKGFIKKSPIPTVTLLTLPMGIFLYFVIQIKAKK